MNLSSAQEPGMSSMMEIFVAIVFFDLLENVPFAPYVSDADCAIYRCIALVFTTVSVISFVFNIHFILFKRNRINPLALSLIVNSLALVCLSLPYVIVQSVNCYPVRSLFICCLQGFSCFTSGISVMYTMSLLALIQYIRLFYTSSIFYRIIDHKHSALIPFVGWFLSFLWSTPPFMNVDPGFVREGQGFDCGLNWKKITRRSQTYLLLAFIFIYFLPLFTLIFTHLRILRAIRKLIHRRYPVLCNGVQVTPDEVRYRLIGMFTVAESNRLKRLRIDRRFAQATMITVVHYILAWTPYATCGMIQMALSMRYIDYQLPSMVLTASALTAKMAVIAQSTVYFYTVRPCSRRFSLTSAALK